MLKPDYNTQRNNRMQEKRAIIQGKIYFYCQPWNDFYHKYVVI
jgi:hypothetical protein